MFGITNQQGNANQNHSERCHLIHLRMAIIKKTRILNGGKDVEEREPWDTVGEKVNWNSHLRETLWSFLKKLKI